MLRCTITASVLLIAGSARADSQRLFDEGRELKEAGKDKEACEKFQQAFDEDPKPGIATNLASCADAAGDFPKAWRLYQSAAAQWADDKRGAKVRKEAEAVARKATTVVIGVPDPTIGGLTLRINGRELKPAREIRDVVAPGTITVTAEAAGKALWRRVVQGKVGETIAVELAFDEPEVERKIDSHVDVEEREVPLTPHRVRRRSWIYTSIGLGAGSIGAFVASYYVAKNASEDYDAILANPKYCLEGRCTAEGVRMVDDAQSRATIGTVLGVGGAVLAAGAIAMFVFAPEDTVLVPAPNGVALAGRF